MKKTIDILGLFLYFECHNFETPGLYLGIEAYSEFQIHLWIGTYNILTGGYVE